MARGTRLGGFDPSGLLKCKKKYGYANGWYLDLQERASVLGGLTVSVCGQCPKTKSCSKLTFAKTKVGDDVEKAMTVIFSFEIDGAIDRTTKNLGELFPDFLPTKEESTKLVEPLDPEQIGEQMGCINQYGYGMGFLFREDVPLCRVCHSGEVCMQQTFKAIEKEEPGKVIPMKTKDDEKKDAEEKLDIHVANIATLVNNMKVGAQARVDGKKPEDPKPKPEPEPAST